MVEMPESVTCSNGSRVSVPKWGERCPNWREARLVILVEVLGFINLLCADILAGEEFEICYIGFPK
jgi:hypothetical protein